MSLVTSKLNIGVIGCGRWGPNHLRVFSELERSRVTACADLNRRQLDAVARRYPQLHVTDDYRKLLRNDALQAVVIATPVGTHAAICREAIEAGKHVLVEKPLCPTLDEAEELTLRADLAGVVLMVGHVFLYNNGIHRLREAIRAGELGRVQYLDAVRTNLGPIRGDAGAFADLGTHDVSICNYLLDAVPVTVSAIGRRITQQTVEDVCFATLAYADGTLAHLHVSWLNPRKVRTLTVVGERKMAHWDDIDPAEPLRLYDKGIAEPPSYNSFGEFQYLLRSGDVHLPAVAVGEPLVRQANAFLDAVLDGQPCESGGVEGCAVAAVLEAAAESMRHGGRFFPVRAVSSAMRPTRRAAADRERSDRVLLFPGSER